MEIYNSNNQNDNSPKKQCPFCASMMNVNCNYCPGCGSPMNIHEIQKTHRENQIQLIQMIILFSVYYR